jgi:hypothetical protein
VLFLYVHKHNAPRPEQVVCCTAHPLAPLLLPPIDTLHHTARCVSAFTCCFRLVACAVGNLTLRRTGTPILLCTHTLLDCRCSGELKGGVAVLTGSASGIGFALAEQCMQLGMHVVLSDIRNDVLLEAVARLQQQGSTKVGGPSSLRCAVSHSAPSPFRTWLRLLGSCAT